MSNFQLLRDYYAVRTQCEDTRTLFKDHHKYNATFPMNKEHFGKQQSVNLGDEEMPEPEVNSNGQIGISPAAMAINEASEESDIDEEALRRGDVNDIHAKPSHFKLSKDKPGPSWEQKTAAMKGEELYFNDLNDQLFKQA